MLLNLHGPLYMTVIVPALQLITITYSMPVSAAITTLFCDVMIGWNSRGGCDGDQLQRRDN